MKIKPLRSHLFSSVFLSFFPFVHVHCLDSAKRISKTIKQLIDVSSLRLVNIRNSIMRAKGMAEGRINMRGKGGVISDCRVSLDIIDEEDNNDTHAREKKDLDFRFLTRANGLCTKFCQGLF